MSGPVGDNHKINTMKRNLTLDFNQAKKANLNIPTGNSVLSSPDLNMLKVGTPELEKMILANGIANTPTPGFRTVAEDPETFASGFVNALNDLHNNASTTQEITRTQTLADWTSTQGRKANYVLNEHRIRKTPADLVNVRLHSMGFLSKLSYTFDKQEEQGEEGQNDQETELGEASDNSSGGTTVYTELDQPNLGYLPPIVKEEPQTVPNINSTTPPMSPVDMEAQERIKLERKRQRNRLAASKCRTRKLERISRLEDKVKHLKNENVELASLVNQLKEHVGLLKIEVMEHVHAGCQIML